MRWSLHEMIVSRGVACTRFSRRPPKPAPPIPRTQAGGEMRASSEVAVDSGTAQCSRKRGRWPRPVSVRFVRRPFRLQRGVAAHRRDVVQKTPCAVRRERDAMTEHRTQKRLASVLTAAIGTRPDRVEWVLSTRVAIRASPLET